MRKPRLFHDKPQTIRLSTADAEWLEREATRRGYAPAVILRELITDGRAAYTLRAQILAAAQRNGLPLRDCVAELLRAEAQRIIAEGRAAVNPALERRTPSHS